MQFALVQYGDPVGKTCRQRQIMGNPQYAAPLQAKTLELSQQLAGMLVIQPWDVSLVKAVEKGIQVANLGFNPIADGKLLRVPLPEMSRERREEFVKVAHKMAEEGRVHVRNVRRECLEILKKAKLPDDETKRLEKEIQTITDKTIKDIGDHLANKEKELLAV